MEFSKAVKRATNKVEKVLDSKEGRFSGLLNGKVISFVRNGREGGSAICFNVRRINDTHDTMTDYYAGIWCDNLGQSIKIALRDW